MMFTGLCLSKGKQVLKYTKILAHFICRQTATGKRREGHWGVGMHTHVVTVTGKNKILQIAYSNTHTSQNEV